MTGRPPWDVIDGGGQGTRSRLEWMRDRRQIATGNFDQVERQMAAYFRSRTGSNLLCDHDDDVLSLHIAVDLWLASTVTLVGDDLRIHVPHLSKLTTWLNENCVIDYHVMIGGLRRNSNRLPGRDRLVRFIFRNEHEATHFKLRWVSEYA